MIKQKILEEKLEAKEYKITTKASPKYPDDTQKLYNRLREAGLYDVEITALTDSKDGGKDETEI